MSREISLPNKAITLLVFDKVVMFLQFFIEFLSFSQEKKYVHNHLHILWPEFDQTFKLNEHSHLKSITKNTLF